MKDGDDETRLALLDVVAKWDIWRTSLVDDQPRFAEENAWEALDSAIESARIATGGSK